MNIDSSSKFDSSYENLYKELLKQKEFISDLDGRIISDYRKLVNAPLRGLVIQKFFKAKSKGINLNIEILDNTVDIEENILDVIRIIGILIDNSIEETINSEVKVINLAFIKNEDTVEICIENPINHSVNIKNIFKKGYSTKGEGHGIGLTNVNELVENNPNFYLDTEIREQKLRITLIIAEVDRNV